MLKVQNNSMECYNSTVQIPNKHLEGLWALLWMWKGWQEINQWLFWEDGQRDYNYQETNYEEIEASSNLGCVKQFKKISWNV